MQHTLAVPFLFTCGAMFFSFALVDLNNVESGKRPAFCWLDLVWLAVVGLSVAWPAWVMYLLPHWQAAAIITILSIYLILQLSFPGKELAKLYVFKLVPASGFWLLGIFSIASAWLVFFYFWIERAMGSEYMGVVNLSL
jgi:hypothetical protein